jgi:hypothetical protein
MDYHIWPIDEYSEDPKTGNEFAPEWPFRLLVSGCSDSGKTTMLMNLIMGNKKVKEDGERYILCDDVILIAKHLNEPKWSIVKSFFDELAEDGEDVSFKMYPATEIPDIADFDPDRATVVIFEDLMNAPKRIQERISDYFSSGRHSNISVIYVSQRYFQTPKTIRENVTHTSLHKGAGSLADLKRIVSLFTEKVDTFVPVIDDLTRKKEFIVFDHRRSNNDPLSIRVRWDTPLRPFLDDPNSINIASSTIMNVDNCISKASKFSLYGKQIIAQAKKTESLIEFAKNMPSPKERSKLLANGVRTRNSDIWARYVFREAFNIEGKDLGPEWAKFERALTLPPITKQSQLGRYKDLLASRPLNDKKISEGLEILLWLLSNKYIDQRIYLKGCAEILDQNELKP